MEPQTQHSTQTETVSSTDMSPSQFGDVLDNMSTQLGQLFQITAEVAKLQKGERLKFPTGQEIGKREVRSLQSQFVKELKSLRKMFAAAKKPKKNNRARRPFTGFGTPIYISETLKNFFRTANLGPALQPVEVDEKGNPTKFVENGQLRDYIQLILEHGVTARGMLTPLFNIYVRVNQMPYTDGNRT